MENCIFCKIVIGEIPCQKILESENFIAIKDANPKVENHSLIISRNHYENFPDIPSELYNELLETTKKTTEKLGVKDFNLVVNNGKNAGQLISHAHLHILPRKEGDRFKLNV
ncbi:MAG: HIT domain-containing protein [Nanoarchaeota archaeon]|nr:HIT domain-containing protein [Nanoarchaeota archaeon]